MRSFFKDDDEQSRCRKVETETVRDDTVNCLNRVGVSGSRAGRVFVSEPGGSVFLPTHRRSELFFSFFSFLCVSFESILRSPRWPLSAPVLLQLRVTAGNQKRKKTSNRF